MIAALKFEHTHKLFDYLRFEDPVVKREYFTGYRGVDLEESEEVGNWKSSSEQILIKFLQEVKENSFHESFPVYIDEIHKDLNDLKLKLDIGFNQCQAQALWILGIEDFPIESARTIVNSLSPQKLYRVGIQRLNGMIQHQHYLILQIQRDYLLKNKTQTEEAPADSSKPYQKLFAPDKINSKLNKKDLLCLMWLLYQAQYLKFTDNVQFAHFLETNFRYSKGGAYEDVVNIKVEIARTFPDDYEKSEEKILRDLASILDEFQLRVMKELKEKEFRPPNPNL